MQRTSKWCLVGLLFSLSASACSDNPTAAKLVPGKPALVLTPTVSLDASINKLLDLFPREMREHDEDRRKAGDVPDLHPKLAWFVIKVTYQLGLTRPAFMTLAKRELVWLSDWVTRNAQKMNTPPDGESKQSAAARLVLYMSLYIYSGPQTPAPPYSPSADAVVGIVTPTTAPTIVTPLGRAGIQFAVGSVAQNTIIVITQNPTPYPANCSGPLDTRLCQYPQFYTFEEFPHQAFLKAASVAVCHVNSGTNRVPLADHDRFKVAHTKPTNPADYVLGGIIRENIEILPANTGPRFVFCGANAYAMGNGLGGPLGFFARVGNGVLEAMTPKTAYAIDQGGGGKLKILSPINDVDPLGTPDLSVESFGIAGAPPPPPSFQAGSHVPVDYTVKNIGTATGGAPATIHLYRPGGVEGPPPIDLVLSSFSIPSLVPGSSDIHTSVDVVIPATAPLGAYSLRLQLGTDPTFPDLNSDNNIASIAITVTANVNIFDLGTLPGDVESIGFAINDAGHVVGQSYSVSNTRPFIWINSTMTSLGSLGGTFGEAKAINNNDVVVGTSKLVTGEYHAFQWTAEGGMTDLGTLEGRDWSFAVGINSSGLIAGYSTIPETTNQNRSWIWQDGVGMTVLPLLSGGTFTIATGINDAGQVTGWGDSDQGTRAWIWQDGAMTMIGTLGGATSAYAINASGSVVGGGYTPSKLHAFLWSDGTITDITVPGDEYSIAEGISSDGRIVGLNFGTSYRAVLWQDGSMIDLGTLGGNFGEAFGINGSGKIVGQSTKADGKRRATTWDAPPRL